MTVSNLGNRDPTGVKAPDNKITAGAWVVTFNPADMVRDADFEVWHGALVGPGGYFHVYLDTVLFGVGANGTINEYTPSIPMYVRTGQTISFHWSISTGTAPTVWLFLRKPEVGKLL